VAKRPYLNELDVPEWAELALDQTEHRTRNRGRLQHAALSRGGDSGPPSGKELWSNEGGWDSANGLKMAGSGRRVDPLHPR
jgi:hypothetical protein